MRVELTERQAEFLRALVEDDGTAEVQSVIVALTPPERLTAILMPEGVTRHTPDSCWLSECDDCGEPIRQHPDHGWIHTFDTDHPAALGDLVPTCPRCGGQNFGYEEGCYQYSPPGSVEDGTVFVASIGWDGIGESGDGEPGLFCDHYRGGGCGAPIDLPDGWEVEWV